ncbi:unnamed protein product [Linum tenue]|uniref:Uncharacterized protein n=1 Tax=Linum tenue TaxID=586396 RepID=A0AAV0HS54_9ROSI|nr:unnamed protein product [Linum tenue]
MLLYGGLCSAFARQMGMWKLRRRLQVVFCS